MKRWFNIFVSSAKKWGEDKAFRLSAALSFYAAFSLGPMLLLVISLTGYFIGESQVETIIVNEFSTTMGDAATETVLTLIESAKKEESSWIMALVSLGILLFSATGLFAQLKDALNTIWGVELKPGLNLFRILRDRALSFAMLVSIGFILLLSLAVSAIVTGLADWINAEFFVSAFALKLAQWAISIAVITLLFALIFKVLPDVIVPWRHVWSSAFITAMLFAGLKELLALYLGSNSPDSVYDAPGSLILVLSWVYFSSMLLLFGAEITYTLAHEDDDAEIEASGIAVKSASTSRASAK